MFIEKGYRLGVLGFFFEIDGNFKFLIVILRPVFKKSPMFLLM